jgi:FdhD protein
MKTDRHSILTCQEGTITRRTDDIVVESPLEIIINGRSAYYCMRMPGMDRELAAGLCFHDGLIASAGDITSLTQDEDGTVRIEMDGTRDQVSKEPQIIRSSSGLFRKERDSHARLPVSDPEKGHRFPAQLLFTLQDDFFSRQEVFAKTGGAHAAALYGIDGGFLAFAEDVGRHNALDKCVGQLLLDGKLHDVYFCMLSSRLSYEMVMKSGRAGARVIAGASAPTSLAVTLARDNDLTLIGFLRQPRFNIYAGEGRIAHGPEAGPPSHP